MRESSYPGTLAVRVHGVLPFVVHLSRIHSPKSLFRVFHISVAFPLDCAEAVKED